MCKYIESCAVLAVAVLWFLKNVYKVIPYCLDGNEMDYYYYLISEKTHTFSCMCIGFVWLYTCVRSPGLVWSGSGSVHVAPDTAVYCRCFMPMDAFQRC